MERAAEIQPDDRPAENPCIRSRKTRLTCCMDDRLPARCKPPAAGRHVETRHWSKLLNLHNLLRMAVAVILISAMNVLAGESPILELRLEPVDAGRKRNVPVKVYLPRSDRPEPMILFSHGLGGSRENNSYLGRFWAAAGYVAVFMQHPGSDTEVWRPLETGKRWQALKEAASPASFRQRIADVSFVIDQLEAWNGLDGHPLQGRLDLGHIGMSGHSFGSMTTLAVAGQKFRGIRSYPDERIDAFLALSPNPGKEVEPVVAFGHLQKPILCMTGTKDGSPVNPDLIPAFRREVYRAMPAGDKYQLVLDGAGHFAFGDGLRTGIDRDAKHHPAIQQISLRFWDAYLRDNIEARQWLQSDQPIQGTGLSGADTWEWK